MADIGLPSSDDEMAVFSDQSEQEVMYRLADWGVHLGALKRGSRGPQVIIAEPSKEAVFKEANSVVDTTAAGDRFNGAFLGSYLQDCDAAKAMIDGHNCSLAVIAQKGAIIPAE